MDHPLIGGSARKLRQQVVTFLRNSYSVMREGNIIFVCGGNAPSDMRSRFKEYCTRHPDDLRVFFPEFAMKNYFSSGVYQPFNIADFEALLADLSHAIVLFPEAAGSYAEAGYFSRVQTLASKTILVMDSKYQGKDSFISLGPADKFNKTSRFNDIIHVSYDNPEFDIIISRIKRIPFSSYRKTLALSKFNALSNYEIFCLTHKCFELLKVATFDDIIFMFRALFKSQISEHKVKQLASILAGEKLIVQTGSYGHYCVSRKRGSLAFARTGYADQETALKVEIAALLEGVDPELQTVIEWCAPRLTGHPAWWVKH